MPRPYLVSFDARRLPHRTADVLIIGGGVAGLRAAVEAGKRFRVVLAAKRTLRDSNTQMAQGGVAAALDRGDTIQSHVKDTLEAGKGIANPKVVRTVIREGAALVRELIETGTRFDRKAAGEISFAREGGHSRARILHAGGDATGAEVARSLIERVRENGKIEVLEDTFAVDLLTVKGACAGALASTDGALHVIAAPRTILATGGCGQLWRETTNPEVATGDGVALAHRAGAELEDVEFVQFHPTALYIAGAARALISEAVRGEGAWLVDRHGKRFMPDQHPMAELAPRDAVSRAIVRQMRFTDDTQSYLTLAHLPAARVRERFPGLASLCGRYGLDIAKDRIPVRPAAHYHVGGVRADLRGRTSLRGLWAAGECACTEFHGANRLGSNSLLEGLVFGVRAARDRGHEGSKDPGGIRHEGANGSGPALDVWDLRASLKSLMWREVGVERDAQGLKRAIEAIEAWKGYVLAREFDRPSAWELQNMLTLAELIARQALARQESRGVHFRTDFPDTDEANWTRHQLV